MKYESRFENLNENSPVRTSSARRITGAVLRYIEPINEAMKSKRQRPGEGPRDPLADSPDIAPRGVQRQSKV